MLANSDVKAVVVSVGCNNPLQFCIKYDYSISSVHGWHTMCILWKQMAETPFV